METIVIRDIIHEHRQRRRDEAFYGVSCGYRTNGKCHSVQAHSFEIKVVSPSKSRLMPTAARLRSSRTPYLHASAPTRLLCFRCSTLSSHKCRSHFVVRIHPINDLKNSRDMP